MSLPVELLEIIFNFCHLGCPLPVNGYDWDGRWLSDSLRIFPYNVAAVDPVWNAILLRHRKYWTRLPRVVFNVDSKTPTHIDDARTLLRYLLGQPDPDPYHNYRNSHCHQFDVAIIRRFKENPDDVSEKERVKNLMDLLAPYMSCFRSIFIDVHASSSLPSNNLMTSSIVSFEYLCDIDDSDSDVVSHEPHDYSFAMEDSRITSHIAPHIALMALDLYTFRRNIAWLRRHTTLQSLTISHLSHVGTYNALGIPEIRLVLEALCSMVTTKPPGELSCLKYLRFRDINFAPSNVLCQAFTLFMRDLINTNLQYLSFEDVDPRFLEDLTQSIFLNRRDDLDYPAPMELHLMCGASSRDIPIKVEYWKYARLVLEGYDQSHLTASYPFDQDEFLSSELHLINCPGFTDSELEILSRVDPRSKDPFFSINLKYLKLTDCHGFTIQALQDMVATRGLSWQKHSRMAGKNKTRLDSLEVSGYGTPLSAKDKDWFMAHVKNFSWDGALFSAVY